jgi:hypothetical protein
MRKLKQVFKKHPLVWHADGFSVTQQAYRDAGNGNVLCLTTGEVVPVKTIRERGNGTWLKVTTTMAVIAACLFLANAAPQVPVPIVVLWDPPADPMWTSYVYRIYGTTNLLAPTNTWPLVTLATNPVAVSNGTRLAFPIALTPAQYFFTMTSSNLWGESPFGVPVLTPAQAPILNNLQLSR